MEVNFEDFRDVLDGMFEEANEINAVRIEPPADLEKLKMFYAIEAYILLLMEAKFEEGLEDFFFGETDIDEWDDMLNRD